MGRIEADIKTIIWWVALLSCGVVTPSFGQAIDRSWHVLTTGNGHGFQVFDRNQGRLIDFLEHPYQFVAPLDDRRDGGVVRRDLAHDAYFGVGVDGDYEWLTRLEDAEYEAETHIIQARTSRRGVQVEVRYFSPFGFGANALLMVIKVSNPTQRAMDISLFAKANLKLGRGRPYPDDLDERVEWRGQYGIETGPGGGHALVIPLGDVAEFGCGGDAQIYEQVRDTGRVNGREQCSGRDQVLTLGWRGVLEPGADHWWGQAILFLNDNPTEPQAADFRDDRTVEGLWDSWQAFADGQGPEQIYRSALEEFEMWRVDPRSLGLVDLTADERAVWRQSEAVLRMGQVMEPVQSNRRNRGMFLAALPIGQWHIGWVRDGAYAIVAQAMAGHLDEARWGVDFLLGAWAGFFNEPDYLGRDYRISSVRYYGNGKEEGDFNAAGPNVETDGFGLTLWAARAYLQYSCDAGWLEQETLHGDTVFQALTQVAADIDALTAHHLPIAECSIWEVHWDHRKVFTYTAATMIRGLFDFAAIADLAGRAELSQYYAQRAMMMLEASKRSLVNQPTKSFASFQAAAQTDVFVDGSTVEMLHWDFVTPGDPIFAGTLREYERLRTPTNGYRRLEERLSLNGEAQAGTYDLSEWIFLDLRVGEMFRRAGDIARAEELLNRVTRAALANDHLIPELFQPDQYGVYAGEVPMVGYGAGAWQMAQLEKAGRGAPSTDADWSRCDAPPMEDAGVADSSLDNQRADGSVLSDAAVSADSGAAVMADDFVALSDAGSDSGMGSQNPSSQQEASSSCIASNGPGSGNILLSWCLAIWAIVRRGRRCAKRGLRA